MQDILNALKTALNVVSNVASMPGVNTLPYVNVIASVAAAAAEAVKFGEERLAPYVEALLRTFKDDKYVPSEEEIAALNTRIAELRKELHAELPPAEPGEPA